MKHKIAYSRATGALVIFFSLCFIILFSDVVASFYHKYVQPTFGKTHFILGYGGHEQDLAKPDPASTPVAAAPGHAIRSILFAPDDDIQQELIHFINQEQKSIKIAIFTFTDKDVATAVLDAHNRGVRVEIVADSAYLRDQYSKIAMLQHHGIPIYTYNPHYKNARQKKQELLSLMHNKFVVFERNMDGRSFVWTGSFNFTRSAKLRNQENVVILDDAYAVKKFVYQFEQLKRRCDGCYERGAQARPAMG